MDKETLDIIIIFLLTILGFVMLWGYGILFYKVWEIENLQRKICFNESFFRKYCNYSMMNQPIIINFSFSFNNTTIE